MPRTDHLVAEQSGNGHLQCATFGHAGRDAAVLVRGTTTILSHPPRAVNGNARASRLWVSTEVLARLFKPTKWLAAWPLAFVDCGTVQHVLNLGQLRSATLTEIAAGILSHMPVSPL